VQQNEWAAAAEIWNKYVNDPDPKIAGWACHNMALAAEMEGDLDAAVEWAKKAYLDYNNKKSRNYINILKNRIADQAKLKEQLD
jgi:hypothetical protein